MSVLAQEIAISNDKLNVFYAGVDNPVSIAAENVSSKEIIVKATGGKIFKENGKYYFHPDSTGKAEIVIYKKSKEIGRRFFRVKNIPVPVFKIGSMRDSMPIAEIAHQQFARAELEGFDIAVSFKVEKFTAYIVSNDTCKAVRITNEGSRLREKLLSEFKVLKQNDIILFKDIVVTDPSGKLIGLKERVITVY